MINPIVIAESKPKEEIVNIKESNFKSNKKVLSSNPNDDTIGQNILCCCCIYFCMCLGLNIAEST